jgi:hypothetical protein
MAADCLALFIYLYQQVNILCVWLGDVDWLDALVCGSVTMVTSNSMSHVDFES